VSDRPFAGRVLGAATATLGLGMAMLYRTGTAVGSRLFMNEELTHPASVRVEQILAIVCLVAVLALRLRATRAIGAAVLFVLATLLAWASMDQGGVPFSEWAMPAHAMRITAPLALLWWCAGPRTPARDHAVHWIVRLAIMTVFAVHGLEALRAHPWFVDLTISGVRGTLGRSLSQHTAEQWLLLVGVLDLAAVVGLLLGVRAAAWYMALWGTFTAVLRLLAYGHGALAETIVRLPHGLLPLLFVSATTPWRLAVPEPDIAP
jgi:hypothetical protein